MDGTQARLKPYLQCPCCYPSGVERVDGTQARLKPWNLVRIYSSETCGKGGWDSGEIETILDSSNDKDFRVERVDGTQARLKPHAATTAAVSAVVERVDGTQARLKHRRKGRASTETHQWKGWMGLRRD